MATAELVFRLARLACVPVDRDIATCLYTALMTDTGSFMFEGHERAYVCGGARVGAGGSGSGAVCAAHLFWTFDGEDAAAGDGAVEFASGRSAGVDLGDAGADDALWGAGRRLRGAGQLCAVDRGGAGGDFFRELPDGRYRISLRSKGEVNVSTVAEHFGGGGHKCASGCSVDGPLAVAVAQIVERPAGGNGTLEHDEMIASNESATNASRETSLRTRTDALVLVAFCGFLFSMGLGRSGCWARTNRAMRRLRARCLNAPIG
jgi:phosphoesterase RecJ-like protein